MSILDTFYILFKSNAKDAEKDMDSLDKKTKQTQESVDKTDKRTKELGLTFSDLVGAISTASGIDFTIKGLVNSVKSMADMEVGLGRLSKLTGIAAGDIGAWDQALQRFGAPAGAFESWLASVNAQYQAIGQGDKTKNVLPAVIALADQWKDLNINQKEFYARQFDLTDDMVLAMDKGGSSLAALISKMKEVQDITNADTDASLALENAWKNVGITFQAVYHDMVPGLSWMAEFLSGIGVSLDNLFQGNWKEFFLAQDVPKKPGAQGGASSASALEESRKFWLSQGYTKEQTAALLGNERGESNFKSGAVGDGGTSFGIFQWHDPSRRAAILAGTGIDVTKASHADQLKAAAWELQHLGYADRLKGANTPGQGAAILTQYENPANAAAQAMIRGKYADDYMAMMNGAAGAISAADNSPLNSAPASGSRSTSVNIGNITINTQATDANGIATDLNNSLAAQMRTAIGSHDDGILY